ncbi:MAG: EAL domain-containing protein [Rhodoferax sp.]
MTVLISPSLFADDLNDPWRLALEGTGAGVWDWNLITGEQTHSARWETMLGYAPGELNRGFIDFLERIHPEDEPRRERALRDYLAGRVPRYEVELRLRCKDGRWKWVWSAGSLVAYDALQRPARMIGVHFDIDARKDTEAALFEALKAKREREQILHNSLAHISQGVVVIDAEGRIVAWNQRLCDMLDLPTELLASKPSAEQVMRFQVERGDHGPGGAWLDDQAREAVTNYRHDQVPALYMRRTAQGRILEVRSTPLPEGGLVRTFSDVTEYVRVRDQLAQSEQRWKLAFEATGDGVWDWHIPTGREYFSDSLHRAYGFEPGELGETPDKLNALTHPDDLGAMFKALYDHVEGRSDRYVNEHRIRCKDGQWKWVLSRGLIIERDPHGRPLRMLGTHTDITERKHFELQAWQQANLDPLTGLPNRRQLRERLSLEMRRALRSQRQLAVLFLDLDRFKEVNDTLGHDQGDRLLAEAAQRIRDHVRATDTVARLGGDEFAVVVGDVEDPSALHSLLGKLLTTLNEAFILRGERVFVSASIGVTLYPGDALDVDDVLRQADQALYVAKGAGRNRYHFFTPDLQAAVQAKVQMTADLREALEQSQFHLVYQPIVELATGLVHKAEVLLRWQHPTHGAVSPAQFIPVAESSGLILPLGEWVFEQAVAQVAQWRQTLHPNFQISINRSPVQFSAPDGLAKRWSERLHANHLPGKAIVVEITEGLLLSDSESVIQELLQLGQGGIQVSLDDFGTGYSSLAYLQKFSVDFVKIDQSFVRDLAPGSTNQALCRAIIAMAHGLGMKVVAEGVETRQQRDILAAEGCDYGQGYYFSRPLQAQALEHWVRSNQATPGAGDTEARSGG